MRDWRKLHKAILTSDRMPNCSFDALWLWALLTVAQDDKGLFPWTKAKVMTITAAYGLTFERASQLAEALVEEGIAEWQDGFIHLINGEVYNGRPRDSRQDFFYGEPHDGLGGASVARQRHVSGASVTRPEGEERERRVEGEESESAQPRATRVTPDFIEEMVLEFGPRLGGEAKAREHISEALNHKAITKRIDKRAYLRKWLQRDVDNLAPANGLINDLDKWEREAAKWNR